MKTDSKITDTLLCLTRDDPRFPHSKQVQSFISAGSSFIQFRSKTLHPDTIFQEAKISAGLSKENHCKLIINDYLDIAKKVGADGVHLGMNDSSVHRAREILSPDKIIGKTVHSIPEARIALKEKPDYVGLGPYRDSKTKKSLSPTLSIQDFQEIVEILRPIPVYLIGGLTFEDFPLIERMGIQGIALCSALCGPFPMQQSLKEIIERSKGIESSLINF
jgi:thiamine-phosphate pyrophosphorylase